MTAQTVTMVTAIVGVVLSSFSLAWQAANYLLTGGRARVTLMFGAMSGSMLVSHPAQKVTPAKLADLASQGYDRPVIGVKVVNVGRQPITVRSWTVQIMGGLGFSPLGENVGKPLPHRLDVGETETWVVEAHHLPRLVDANKVLSKAESVRVRGVVELGNGKSRKSRNVLRMRVGGSSEA